jgi:hypothetical protein
MRTVSGEAIPLSRLAVVMPRSGPDLQLFLPRRESSPINLPSLPPISLAPKLLILLRVMLSSIFRILLALAEL